MTVDLFDFFFPEQAQAHHLRKVASNQATQRPPETDEVNGLRADVNFLTLVVTALLRKLAETKTASPEDIQGLIEEIDALDGVADGGLSPSILRGMLGVLKTSPDNSEGHNNEFKIKTSN